MASGSFLRRPAVLLALALGSVAAVVTVLGRLATGPAVEQKRVPLAAESGTKTYPSFAPDGKRVVYSARGFSKGETLHVYVRAGSSDTPRQMTSGESSETCPVWSPDGNSIAFLRTGEGKAGYFVVPVNGGGERLVAEYPSAAGDDAQPLPAISWTRDGKGLVVVATAEKAPSALALRPLDGGAPAVLTHPPANSPGDSTPAVSPDGAALAFFRATGEEGGDIWVVDLSGRNERRVTFDDRSIRGLSWTPDGQEIVYASDRLGQWRLWRVSAAGGAPKAVNAAGNRARYPAVAPLGHVLVYADSHAVPAIWRGVAGGQPDAPAEQKPLVRSSGRESSPAYSPDGSRIADISDQTGYDELWVSDAEGGNRQQITHLNGPPINRVLWSPDGRSLLFDARGESGPDLFSVTAAPGARPKRLLPQSWNASWAHDGKHIYFDTRGEVWKANADGSNPEQVTKFLGAAQGVETPDGKYLYFRARRSIYRMPVAGGEAEEAIVPDHELSWITTIEVTRKGVYYAERSARHWVVSFYDFAAKKSSTVFRMENPDFGQGHIFSISPDGKYVLYPRVDQSQSDLMLVENFR